jgi:hypothetical protein
MGVLMGECKGPPIPVRWKKRRRRRRENRKSGGIG